MIKERPLNDKETRILKKDLKNLDKRNTFQKQFMIGWTIVAIIVGTIVFFRLDSKNEYYLLFGTVLVYILIGVWVFLENFLKTNQQRKSIDFVLTTNKAKSINIVSEKYGYFGLTMPPLSVKPCRFERRCNYTNLLLV